uniref:NADH dehydrogenase subunit 4L n=1 Tax=Dermatobranchus otome TaxID=1504997 RepID=UPI001FF6240B|nr:NADH dehydrogenase subunit 4L [Dermatobranchus otome]UOD76585.1 NADH dehydrogenase subunit 4L [Dermatobranchus otome]UOD76598.1 NADH dehydrogenase subunit 4L [Dermatobranchus otome]
MFLVKVSGVGIISSVISFSKLNIRILGVLISLEALMLSLLTLLYGVLGILGVNMHYFLVLLTFAACEAALGLALLVSILRIRSNDYIASFSSLNFYV